MGTMLVGVISDTHGLLRAEALAALRGCELIIHAGDVGRMEVLAELRQLAPVVAVRGNVDHGPWADALAPTEIVQAGEAYLYVLHDLKQLDLDPAAGGFSAVISGHSHKPAIDYKGGVLYLNPGSAGPRRFSLPISLARLQVTGRILTAELVELHV
jgi:putative phosphoesterase